MGVTIDIWKLLTSVLLIVLFWKGFWLILSAIGWVFRFIKDFVSMKKDKLLDKWKLSSEEEDKD